MNKVIFILLISSLIAGCSKVKKTKKELNGEWQVVSYKFTNLNGLSYFYSTQENAVTFENCDSEFCGYSIFVEYENQGDFDTLNFSGQYKFKDEKAEYFDMLVNNKPIIDTIKDARIILITKDDLMTEFNDDTGRHLLVMKK